MNILEKITAHKQKEVAERKSLYPVKLLEKSIYFETPPVSLKKYLLREDKVGIIAEIKRKSPSKGIINQYISVEQISIGYMQAGASALSVLTDAEFFGGSNEDLAVARKFNYCPILRKDFIIDEYQVIEAKSIGADAVLLITAALELKKIKELTETAKKLGLEVLLEVHTREEFDKSMNDLIDIIGVNNRNLKDFTVDMNRSIEIANVIPKEVIKISESGIGSPEAIHKLKEAGYNGFLIGETFMLSSRPEKACADFIKNVQTYRSSKTQLGLVTK
ncbi:indole-3-glycerol phosphate synthase TrpC [bacterium AH-315-M05]|nr:indole-3-glycerol phosphate synthase TrpC [bacterium AH-315-M05]